MPKTSRLTRGAPYVRRVLQDQYVQEELGQAASRLRQAYRRAAGQSKRRAAQDRKLYALVREAATSLSAAGSAIQRKPKPKRGGRKLLALALLVGAAVAVGPGRVKVSSLPSGGSADELPTPPDPPSQDDSTVRTYAPHPIAS